MACEREDSAFIWVARTARRGTAVLEQDRHLLAGATSHLGEVFVRSCLRVFSNLEALLGTGLGRAEEVTDLFHEDFHVARFERALHAALARRRGAFGEQSLDEARREAGAGASMV